MKLELMRVLDRMLEFYGQPVGMDRFEKYLTILHGETHPEIALPVSGFNPMAKDHVKQKLLQLKAEGVEELMLDVIMQLNHDFAEQSQADAELQRDTEHDLVNGPFRVAFNLSDDEKGGWTNRYTSDFDSRFRNQALLKRHFIVPVFWVSEVVNETVIRNRAREYCRRSIYQL